MVGLFLFTSVLLVLQGVTSYDIMKYAEIQYSIVYDQFLNLSGQYYPYYGYPLEEKWAATTATTGWTPGFTPGVFWYIFEHEETVTNLRAARAVTEPTAPFANRTDLDDVSFTIMCGFGNGYRSMKYPSYLEIIFTGARSLSTRYSPTVRCTRSWDSDVGFLVNIDNMMDLEILFEASKQSMYQTWHNIAWQHANRTMYENFRPDNSTYHMIEYNETDGSVIRKYTAQGYADWSTWSRGQAWGTYGFTMAYRYTKYQPFLDKAIAAANYFLSRLPSATDLIPYWDFDAPFNSTIPYQPRDTSAAAILASGLIELSEYVMDSDLKTRYLNSSKAIIAQLSTPKYLLNGNKDYKLPALLANGTLGPYPRNPYDVALSFGDYYFVEAAVRLSKL